MFGVILWSLWLPDFKPQPLENGEMMPLKVNEPLMPLCRDWDEPKLREIFDEESVSYILRIPIPSSPKNDAIFRVK